MISKNFKRKSSLVRMRFGLNDGNINSKLFKMSMTHSVSNSVLAMLQSRSSDGAMRLDLNKITLFLTSVAGTTILKGIVDMMPKKQDNQ